ncbi:hypothetical protein QFC20_004185 [Naganishia adeliensis]|uniref:Uncharacterized protein n=1 Tax=Naganishia adeliensis TaxID=92952 RepID=A0ACC2W282_9TREE|nr:hypothetical protein QFC20_004185 [Naganishia adeliensis]
MKGPAVPKPLPQQAVPRPISMEKGPGWKQGREDSFWPTSSAASGSASHKSGSAKNKNADPGSGPFLEIDGEMHYLDGDNPKIPGTPGRSAASPPTAEHVSRVF